MKNKVLKTIGYIVGITWLFTACALDDEVYGMTMLFINVLCTAYLALFSWANNWWVGHNSSRTLQSVNDSPLRTGKTRNLAGTKGSGRRAV